MNWINLIDDPDATDVADEIDAKLFEDLVELILDVWVFENGFGVVTW